MPDLIDWRTCLIWWTERHAWFDGQTDRHAWFDGQMDMPDWWTYRHAWSDTDLVISLKHSLDIHSNIHTFIDASFLYIYLHSNDNDDNDGDDDDSDDDSDGADDGVSYDHNSENGDFSDESIVMYEKNNDNDDDRDDDKSDDDDNDDDYDVGDDSQPPQLFLALSDSVLFMI